ncbi:RDD family protein [Tersicoccus solisilvae]|nr:RDD family protein [Tersicoccus solisilvae]
MSTATPAPASEPATAAALPLVNASTGKRLVARLIDALVLVLVVAVTAALAAAQGPQGASAPSLAAGAGLAVTAVIAQWWWEATRGRTVGGVTVGIRTVDARAAAPGWWRVLVRTVIVAVAGVLPVVGPLLVTVSNVWDRDRQRQGWHDKAAGTWVVDAALGRDPLAGDGARSRRDAPAAGERTAGSASPAPVPAPAPPAPAPAAPAPPAPAPAPAASVPAPAAASDDLEHTRASRPRSTAWRLAFDDGSAVTLRGEALVGRNPVNAPEEPDVLLVNLPDPGRSISKTHAHLAAHADGVWVSDRRSTNGTAITPPHADRTVVEPGVPMLAVDGALVHLGDRTIVVTRT